MWILFSFHILYNSLKTSIFKELLKNNPLTMLTNFKRQKTLINKFKISLSLLASYLNIFLIFGFWDLIKKNSKEDFGWITSTKFGDNKMLSKKSISKVCLFFDRPLYINLFLHCGNLFGLRCLLYWRRCLYMGWGVFGPVCQGPLWTK